VKLDKIVTILEARQAIDPEWPTDTYERRKFKAYSIRFFEKHFRPRLGIFNRNYEVLVEDQLLEDQEK
jgi:hypothetical protein